VGLPVAFEAGAFQVGPAWQTGPAAYAFGWANVIAVSQWGGVQGARSAYPAGDACAVDIAYFDLEGQPFVPQAVSYRVDDVLSQMTVVPWTPLDPFTLATTNQVEVTAVQNSMISFTREWELRQVLFSITDGYGNLNLARTLYALVRILGGSYVLSEGYQDLAFQDTFQVGA
jgi:hypothetical protein